MDLSELLGTIGKTEEEDKISYSAGVVMALSLQDVGFDEVSYDDFLEGMKSVFTNSYPKISQKKAIDIFNNYLTLLREDIKQKNLEDGRLFLEKNAQKDSVFVTPSGLQYEILQEGNGRIPSMSDSVRVIYEGYLLNNTVFDSTKQDGPQDFNLTDMIQGWQEALTNMPEGSRWKLYIPPYLAYGDEGAAPMVQPNATISFIVELIQIN